MYSSALNTVLSVIAAMMVVVPFPLQQSGDKGEKEVGVSSQHPEDRCCHQVLWVRLMDHPQDLEGLTWDFPVSPDLLLKQ